MIGFSGTRPSLIGESIRRTELVGNCKYNGAVTGITPLDEAKRDLDLLLLEPGHGLQRHALAAVNASAFRRNAHFEATSLPTLIAMVGEGLGTTLFPDLAVPTRAAVGQGVRLTPLPDACPRWVALV